MVSNTDNNGMGDDLDDDVFEGGEFNESDFDGEVFDENEFTDDLPEGDLEYSDEDFADEEWEEPAADKKGKKEKSLYQTGEKKGLSFNTIVIIGAVVVGGGVMMMTVMNKSAEVAAGNQGIFHSILNISGVMDGTLFGEKEAAITPEEAAALEQNTQEQGFLNNPDVLNNNNNPPQPVPIAPSETADGTQPLVPLPEDMNMGMPRGPDEGVPANNVAIAETPLAPVNPISPDPETPSETPFVTDTPPSVSAEDILKKAMANREKKIEEAKAPVAEEAPAPAPTPEPQPVAEATQPPTTPAPEATPPAVVPAPVQSPVAAPPAPVVPAGPSTEEFAANTKALETLGSRIEEMMKRMEKIEGDLGSVRETKTGEYQQLEQSLSGLKQEITDLKNRPAPAPAAPAPVKAAETPAPKTPAPQTAEPVAEKPKPVAKKVAKKAPVPKKTAPAADTASVRWELRAAQPGRAWVSKPGARDMQGIEVGQTLAGIGRVTSITYQNGRWAVIGTQGQIRQ